MGKDKKSKENKKERKEKKEKRSSKDKRRKEKKKHRRRSSSPSSSSGSSGSDVDVQTKLQKGRSAVRATREILAYNTELRKDLRELVRQLDTGGALDVSGIPDTFLRSRLLTLFDNLVQLRKNSAGQYFLRRGASSTVLSFVAPILEESAEQLAPYRLASEQHAAAEAARQAAAAQPPAGAEQQQDREAERQQNGAAERQSGPVGPPPRPQQQEQQQEGLVESDSGGDDDAAAGPPAGPIGPTAPPPGLVDGAGAAEEAGAGGEEGAAPGVEGEDVEEPAGQRVAGPAMPPAEWLAAAAQMEYPVSEGDEEAEEDMVLVGPPPPEVVEELDLASMDDRSAEVARVLRVLQLHDADHAKSTAAQKADSPPDAYDVLGVAHDAPAGDIKKRYWRLSLLIHPDKCDHPRAHDAFQLVTAAARELQDAALRKRVDERREEAELRREFEAQAAQAERERQWRVARGEPTAADLAGPAAVPGQPLSRDTWMTDLPPERRMPTTATMPTGPFSGFSQRGIKPRGDTSGWTMTPEQRALQLEGGGAGGGPGGGPLMLTSGGADAGVAAADPAQAARMAAAVDAFNTANRKKSLMEVHAERLAGGGKDGGDKKKRKKQKTGDGKGDKSAAGAADLGYDPSAHPWRPFDREKDLGPGLQAKAKASDLLQGARSLGSKFGGGQGGGRTFL